MQLTKSLLPQRNTLQLVQSVFLSSTVDHRILEQRTLNGVVDHCRLALRTVHILGWLKLPRIAALAVHQTRIVVALVKILKHRGEDLGRLVGESDTLSGVERVVLQNVVEVRSADKDILVGGEYSLFGADDKGDDGTDAAERRHVSRKFRCATRLCEMKMKNENSRCVGSGRVGCGRTGRSSRSARAGLVTTLRNTSIFGAIEG